MSYSEFVLPYVAEDDEKRRRFSPEMEVSALLCLAEADRKKKPGIFGGAVETLTVLSKLHYPLWAVPWEDKCLLLDGTGAISYPLLYSKPPDVEAFVEHLKRSSAVQELFSSALRSHKDTFSDFLSTTEIPLEGLVSDEALLSDIALFAKDAQPLTHRSRTLIPLRIRMGDAVKLQEKISKHHDMLQSELKGLQYAIDALDEEVKVHAEKLKQELELIREKYEEKITATRAEVDEKTNSLARERDAKIEAVAAGNKKEVERLLKEKRQWEQELTRLEQDRSEYEKRIEVRKHRKDEVGESRWNAKLREAKNQISTVKGKIKALSGFISRSNKETEKTIKSVRETYGKMVALEEKKISDLATLRDSRVKEKEKEIDVLQKDATTIREKIKFLIDEKRTHASSLRGATIQWKPETPTLLHVPFYLVQYEADQGKSSRVHPPTVPRATGGLVTRLRETLTRRGLKPRLQALLKSRSTAIETLLKGFEDQLNRNEDLQRSLDQVSSAGNLLLSPDFKARVRKGIEELESEEWIKPEEKDAVLAVYAA